MGMTACLTLSSACGAGENRTIAFAGAVMIDRYATAFLQPYLRAVARVLARRSINADTVTIAGFGLGVTAALLIANGLPHAGLASLLASRLCDGLDGALARETRATDAGAFLDIALDFLFYASVPLAFALAEPAANALPAATLLAAFIGSGTSFLAFAILAERRGLAAAHYPAKGFYYLGGLTEAGETLICFAGMCLWPGHFAYWAYGFAALCALTALSRITGGWWTLRDAATQPSDAASR
jgi:phosphatidylglycerophosphate synthase